MSKEVEMNRHNSAVGLLALLCVVASQTTTSAQLAFHYDPETGNVSFDTVGTASDGLHMYILALPYGGMQFRSENFTRLTASQLITSGTHMLSEAFVGAGSVSGVYTIGDVLPVGMTESEWSGLFATQWVGSSTPSSSWYSYMVGRESGVGFRFGEEPAEFIYGLPDRPFDNRWDLVDPDTLTWASEATLVYRDWSGELLVDTRGGTGGHISMILLESDGRFDASGFEQFAGGPFNVGDSDTLAIIADAIEPGLHSLGTVLPTGLSAEALEGVFTTNLFLGRAGFQGSSFSILTEGQTLSLSVESIPEPSAFAAATLVLVGSLVRRRRSRIDVSF